MSLKEPELKSKTAVPTAKDRGSYTPPVLSKVGNLRDLVAATFGTADDGDDLNPGSQPA